MKRHTAHGLALAALLVGGMPAALAAQASEINADNTPYGTTSGEFLLLGASARGAALGNAFQAIVNDVSALYYNPAGAALMESPGVLISTYSYVANTTYSWGGLAFPFSGGARAVGLHLGNFGFKDQPEYTVELPDGTGATYSVSESYIGLTYAENFSDRFSAGLTMKGVFDQLGEVNGSAFAVEIEADDITWDELALLLGLLERWDGGLWSALGGKRGKGWGRVEWSCVSVQVVTPAGLAEWLDNADAPLTSAFATLADVAPGLKPIAPADIAPRSDTLEIPFRLLADGPILVNEPGYRRIGTKADEHPPTHEFSRRPDGRSIIPGKSLIGVVRARARRILATIAHQHCGADPARAVSVAEELTKALFGDAGRRGALWISDAEADETPEDQPIPHPQFFNAIDRFTGGVKGPKGAGALFSVNACADGSYTGQVLLETARLPNKGDRADWWKGLLLLVARDAVEGDLAVGWGKAKGYGAFRVVPGEDSGLQIGNWSELVAACAELEQGEPSHWLGALHKRIDAEIGKPNADGQQP